MKLTKLKVKNLLGKNDIEWNFNPNSPFNILVGNNGSGKSTLLNIIASIVADSRFDTTLKHKIEDRFESAELYYRDNSSTKKQDNDEQIQLETGHSKPLQFWCSNQKCWDIDGEFYSIYLNGLKPKQLKSYIQAANEFLTMNDKELKSEPSDQPCSKIKLVLVDNKTGKQINVTSPLEASILLSHGERELLKILFWTVALNKYPYSFIFLHNPETHLHLNWQENLLLTLRKLNSNAQFFIKTHSPAIIMNGWNNLYVDMNEIIV
jgi:conserved uncharacterized protein